MALLVLLAFATLTQRTIFASNMQAAAPAAEARSAPEQLTTDTSRVTAGGASFMVPAGWSIVTGKNLVMLQPSEPDTHIAIIDTQATDAASAIAAGWSAYKPEHKWPVKVVTSRPPREGWEDRQVFDYETSPNGPRSFWMERSQHLRSGARQSD